MLANFLLVALGGAIGAILRYAISLVCLTLFGESFPWGTFVANSIGCFLMGLLLAFGVQKEVETTWLLAGVGVLGALTTFSSFTGESLQLWIDGNATVAATNVLANVLVCLFACWLGFQLASLISGN